MNISVNRNQARNLYESVISISRLYVREVAPVYARARDKARVARGQKAYNEVKAVYRQFERDTGLTMREFSKLEKLL